MTPLESVIPPWSDQESWCQMKLSLEISARFQGERLDVAREISHQIENKICSIDGALDILCQATCVDCHDICCGKATLWYDFRDLLFIYLNSDKFPQQQIWKKKDLSCSCLTLSGCSLKRCERPFICTWYICPKQTGVMQKKDFPEEAAHVTSVLQEIKSNRKMLEKEFIDVVSSIFPKGRL